jgi:hypothetical protein
MIHLKKFNEEIGDGESNNFKVVFEGFKSEEDAINFAKWYEGSGEQNASDDLNSDLTIDMQEFNKRGGFKSNENGEVILPLKK